MTLAGRETVGKAEALVQQTARRCDPMNWNGTPLLGDGHSAPGTPPLRPLTPEISISTNGRCGTKHLREREDPARLPFSPTRKGEPNSQGPIEIEGSDPFPCSSPHKPSCDLCLGLAGTAWMKWVCECPVRTRGRKLVSLDTCSSNRHRSISSESRRRSHGLCSGTDAGRTVTVLSCPCPDRLRSFRKSLAGSFSVCPCPMQLTRLSPCAFLTCPC